MKINKSLILIIAILIVLNSSINVFANNESSYKRAREEGEEEGYSDGLIKGSKNSSDKPYYKVILDEDEVYDEYEDELEGESRKYKENFYEGYVKGFKKGYRRSTKDNDDDDDDDEDNINTNYADSLGTLLGETYGFRDYYNGSRSNWYRAIPSDSTLDRMFNLRKQKSSYRSSFYSEFEEAFEKSYEDGYEKANLESEKVTIDSGIADGEIVGTILGSIHGSKDYFENRTNNYSRNKPTNRSIILDFSLNSDTKEYREGFLIGFNRKFQEEYNNSYREVSVNSSIGSSESAYEDGKTAGVAKGELQANHDYSGKRHNNWRYNGISSSQIIAEYNLSYQSKDYRNGFIGGFLDGFSQGYSATYNSLSQNYVVEKSIVQLIPKSGGVVSTKDGELSVEIERGTFYNDISISIETISDSNYTKNSRYIKASKLYNIQITNKSGEMNKDKKIKLSFNYFDNYRGGVYKKIDDKFVYINSGFEEDKIILMVNPSTLISKDNIYCVQIDKGVSIFPDARSNWANDEINTFVRRNIINGYSDGYFRPESNVTRAEFLTILSRVYNWEITDNKNSSKFKDYSKFGNSDKVISYAVGKGYINGYDDNTFKPNNPISYREVEIIMSRVLDTPSLKWYNTAAKMMYEKHRKSNSYNSMNNKATRAEIVYMLNILNEWRY